MCIHSVIAGPAEVGRSDGATLAQSVSRNKCLQEMCDVIQV